MNFVSEDGDDHDLSRFDSGKPDLDRWLREFARPAAANRAGRTFVWHAGDGVVVAYYTLAAHEVAKTDRAACTARAVHGSERRRHRAPGP